MRDIFVNTILSSYFMPMCFRLFFLNLWGCHLKGPLHGHYTLLGKNLELGKGSFINKNCLFDNAFAKIIVGDNVAISHNCVFLTTNHDYQNDTRRGGGIFAKDIIVENGVWIGAHVTILPGTIIRSGCVICAGSVVRGELLSNRLYGGNPAKVIKDL
jgi:galactoside O-acetyltransferase